jgi:hypothetical protein
MLQEIERAVTLTDCAAYAKKLSNVSNLIIKKELEKRGLKMNYAGVQTGVSINPNGEVHSEFMNFLKQINNIFADISYLYVENIVLKDKLRKSNPPQFTEIEVIND